MKRMKVFDCNEIDNIDDLEETNTQYKMLLTGLNGVSIYSTKLNK